MNLDYIRSTAVATALRRGLTEDAAIRIANRVVAQFAEANTGSWIEALTHAVIQLEDAKVLAQDLAAQRDRAIPNERDPLSGIY